MAKNDGPYMLTGQAVAKLGQMVRWWERQARNYHPPRSRQIVSPMPSGWVGVLAADLNYHSSATVNLYKWSDADGHFIDASQTATCYPWCLKSGDSIPSGTQVIGFFVGGKRVVYEGCCSTGT